MSARRSRQIDESGQSGTRGELTGTSLTPLLPVLQDVWMPQMRAIVSAAGILAVALISVKEVPADQGTVKARRPNVVMIVVDDLNDWIEPLQGHSQSRTPCLNSLAERGMTFSNAHCQAPLCNPSRTSVLTGLRPTTTGIYGLQPWFRNVETLKDIVTLPQYFSQNGYQTYSAGKVFHGEEARKSVKPEFDVWGPVAVPGARPKAKLVPPTPNGNHPLMDWGTFPHRDEENGDHQIATWAAGQISAMPKGQPYFLAVGFSLPHVPCYAPPKWFDLFPPGELEMAPILEADREDTPEFSWYLHWSLPEPRLSWLRENNQLSSLTRSYLASVAFVDHQIGRVLRAVEESAEADNTLIVLWSDHGFHLGEKGISGKNSLWEPSTRVPLFFAGPGVRAGETCVQPVELLDIFPTLVELCGLPKKDDIEGLSLKSQLQQPETCRKRPAITACNPGNHSVRDVRWRYIVYADGSREMYDLSIDPNEYFNRANLPESKMQMEAMHSLIPSNVAPHASGSKHRILHKAGGLWLWEGKPIVRDELQR